MSEKIISMKNLTHDDICGMDVHEEDKMWMELVKQAGGSVIHLEEVNPVK